MLGLYNRVKSAVGSAVESVAPLIRSNRETLEHSWKKVEEEYAKLLHAPHLDDPSVLTGTKLEDYLNTLAGALLEEEQDQRDKGTEDTGPCFEFLLQKNVIDRLCAVGLPDRPPGIRSLITHTLDIIFAKTRKPLLPNMSVHLAVRQFMMVCVSKGDLRSKYSKARFLSFLRTLCLKLREDPSLSWVFFEERPQGQTTPEFLLFSTLLSLLNDGDDYANSAIEGILCCVQLPDRRVADYVVQCTDFADQLVLGLRKLHEQLPSVLEMPTDEFPDDDPSFLLFFKRLALMDVVSASTFPELGEHVARRFATGFLSPVVAPALLHMEEKVVRYETLFVKKMLEKLESKPMVSAMVDFLLGSTTRPETHSDEKQHPIRHTLICRIDSISEEVAVSTLGLFEALVGLRNELVIKNLLLRNLSQCKHIKRDQRERVLNTECFEPVELNTIIEAFPALQEAMTDRSHISNLSEGSDDDSSLQSYLVDAQNEEQCWMVAYESWESNKQKEVDPETEELDGSASPGTIAAGSATATPVKSVSDVSLGTPVSVLDAISVPSTPFTERKGEFRTPAASSVSTPAEASLAAVSTAARDPSSPASVSVALSSVPPTPQGVDDDGEEPEFFEGLFITTILRKLDSVFKNSFICNLRLTGLLSALAYCPHPLVHSYLLQPRLHLVKGLRMPLHALSKLWNEGRDRAAPMPNFQKRLQEARKRLDSPDNCETVTMESFDVEKFLQGIIVLEEFVKELLAICQAKSNLQGLTRMAKLSNTQLSQPLLE